MCHLKLLFIQLSDVHFSSTTTSWSITTLGILYLSLKSPILVFSLQDPFPFLHTKSFSLSLHKIYLPEAYSFHSSSPKYGYLSVNDLDLEGYACILLTCPLLLQVHCFLFILKSSLQWSEKFTTNTPPCFGHIPIFKSLAVTISLNSITFFIIHKY